MSTPEITPIQLASSDLYAFAVERAADLALETGSHAVAVGYLGTDVLICTDRCCIQAPGAIVAVADVKIAEFAANGFVPDAGTRLDRSDGRSVTVFSSPMGVGADVHS